MGNYSFSVGTVEVWNSGSSGTLVQSLAPATDINIDWALSTYRDIGPNGELLEEFKDEETTTISIDYAGGSLPVTLIKGDYYDS